MIKRAVTIAVGVAALFCATALPASADSLGTSYAAAATVSPGTGMTPTVTTSGELAGLFDFLTPVFDQFVTPLTSALTAFPDSTVDDVATAVRDQDATAAPTATPDVDANGYPDCGDAEWGSGNCYATNLATASGSTVSVSADDARGFAGANDSSSVAGARTSGITLAALGIQLADIGTAESRMSCGNDSACTGSGSFSDLSLLDGAVHMKSADDGSVLMAVGSNDFVPVAQAANVTVPFGTRTAAVSANGNGVQLAIPLSLDELLGALGVPDSLAGLDAAGDGSTITLDVIVTAGEAGDQHGALQIGLGISADIHLSVLGLSDIAISLPDTPSGNLMSVEFAYSAAKNSSATTSDPVTSADLK